VSELEAHRAAALAAGRLVFQRCDDDGTAWLPARTECPTCLGTNWSWADSAGLGRLVSWVVYHYAPTPELAADVPYQVALVALAEGPSLITRVLDLPAGVPVDAPVRLEITERDGRPLPTFRLA
jgi:uncharacterized protein